VLIANETLAGVTLKLLDSFGDHSGPSPFQLNTIFGFIHPLSRQIPFSLRANITNSNSSSNSWKASRTSGRLMVSEANSTYLSFTT
jgi:hypothetical protein